jgi:hypothetical protein
MRRPTFLVLAVLGCATPAAADPVPAAYNLRYEALSLGITIMQMDVSVRIFPHTYDIALSYHTTGLAGFLYHGWQTDEVTGVWEDDRASPQRYLANGQWRGKPRRVDIAYRSGSLRSSNCHRRTPTSASQWRLPCNTTPRTP